AYEIETRLEFRRVLFRSRLAPTVAVTLSDPGFALQVSRQAGLSPQAVGPDGRPVAEELTHSLRGGPVEPDLVTIEGPELKVPARSEERRAGEETTTQ